MDGGLWDCTGASYQDHPQEKEMQKGKMVVFSYKQLWKEEKQKTKERRKDIAI